MQLVTKIKVASNNHKKCNYIRRPKNKLKKRFLVKAKESTVKKKEKFLIEIENMVILKEYKGLIAKGVVVEIKTNQIDMKTLISKEEILKKEVLLIFLMFRK